MRIFYRSLVALFLGTASPLLAATPVISNVSIPNAAMKVGQTVTATITVTSDAATYTLVSGTIGGFTLGSLNKLSNTSYEATFQITDGGTDVAAGSNIPVANLVLADAALQNTAYTQNISQAGDPIDANVPTITNVTVPAVTMKVNDVVTATITVGNDGGETYTLTSGTIGGFTLGSFTRVSSTSYTATFTVTNGGTDVPAASNIPVSLIIADVATNPSATYTTAIAQAGDRIDANVPTITSVTVPAVTMKVNDVVTATITVGNDGGETYTLTSGTIGGFTLGSFTRVSSTSYTATFTVTNGGTDVPAASNIPVSLIIADVATNPSATYTTAISQAGDRIDANVPAISNITIPNVNMKVGDVVTATITVGNDGGETYTLTSGTIGGFTLGSFTRVSSTSYTATFTIANGGTDVPAASNIPVSVIIADVATNPSATYTTAIAQAGDRIDANAPSITAVSIPNVSMKVNDVVTATITVADDGGETYTLNASTIGGFTLGSLSRTNNTTYTATFTITNGGTDVAAASNIPVSVSLSDVAGSPSTAFTTAIAQAGDPIDANNPAAPSTPDLDAASDSGASNTDNYTNDDTPTFSGTAEANATVNLYRAGSTLIGTTTANGTGNWSITASTLADGAHTITARTTDAAGNQGPASSGLNITIDTVAPTTAPATPDLDTASDTGASTSDNITNDATPDFDGTNVAGVANMTIQIRSNLDGVIGTGTATAAGGWNNIPTTIVTTAGITGTVHTISARAIDQAGNAGPSSGNLSVTVDVTAPTVTAAAFFADNQHIYNCNGQNTTEVSSTELFHLTMSEALGMTDGTIVTVGNPGFSVSAGSLDTSCETGGTRRGASVYHSSGSVIHLKSTNLDEWNGTTTVSFTSGVTNIRDVAGNGMATFTNLLPSDTQAPTLASGLVFSPNGAGAETITFQLGETLNASVGSTLTGFTTSTGTIATQNYNSATNTVTLTSTTNGMWTDAVTVTYTQATGNVIDPANNELAAFTNTPIRLINVNLASNNANGFTARAKTGDVITLGFTTTTALSATPTATIGGQVVTVTGGPTNYSATLNASAVLTEGVPLAISINALTANDATDVIVTTNSSQVIYDNTAPSITPITIVSDNPNTALARPGNTITLTFTVNETLFGTPTVTIGGRAASVSNVSSVYTATLLLNGTESEGNLAFSISLQDQVGNGASATATTNASVVNYNKTVPTVSAITLLDPSPTSNSTVNFQVVFTENVTGVNAGDFVTFGTASGSGESISNVTGSGTTYTVEVSGIGTIGTLGLTLVDNNSIIDAHTNPLGGTAPNDGDFSSPTPYQIALPAPSNHAAGFSITSTSFASLNLSWVNPLLPAQAASGYLITIARSGATAIVPVNGTPIANQTDLINNNTGYLNVVPVGVGPLNPQTLTLNTLLSGETYTIYLYPYTNSGPAITYKLNAGVPNDSDITLLANDVWTNNQNPVEPASFPVTTTTSGVAVVNFRFMIEDDAWNRPGPENASTKITAIRIRRRSNDQIGDWNNALSGVELTDGTTTKTGVIDPGGNFITFSNLYNGTTEFFGEVGDNAIKYYSLKLILKTPLTGGLSETIDNKAFVVEMNNADFTLAPNSSRMNAGNDTPTWALFSNVNNNKVSVTADHFAFTTNPIPSIFVLANVTAPSTAPDFVTRPVVRALDALGNTDLDYNNLVAVTNAGSIPMLDLVAPNNIQAVNGVITFPVTFRYNDDGNGTLTVAEGSFTATSTPVNVIYSNTTTITAGAFAEPTTFSSLRTSALNYDINLNRVFDFDIHEDNNTAGDLSPTRITEIVITQGTGNDVTNWLEVFEDVLLYDGVNEQFGTISADRLTFPVTPTTLGLIGDNATKNYRLFVRLKTALGGTLPTTIDGLNLVFEVLDDNIQLDNLSSAFTGTEDENSGAANVAVEVLATKIRFIAQPPLTASVDANLTAQPVVEATDFYNNRDLGYGAALAVTNAGTLTMINAPTAFTAGVSTFPANFRYRNAGNGTLTVTSGALIAAGSTGVVVTYSGQSDIIRDVSFTYPNNIPYINHLATNIIQDGNSIDMERFILRDGGLAANDLDGADTRVGSIDIQITNGANIRRLALYDGATELGEVTPVAGLASFTGLTLTAADNNVKVFTLRASFLNTVTDNQVISFEIMSVTPAIGIGFGSAFTDPDGGGALSVLTGDNNRIEVLATQLDFTTPSGATSASLNTTFAAVVAARDTNANTDLDFTGNITVFTTTAGLTTTNNPTGAFVAGVKVFPTGTTTGFQYLTDGGGTACAGTIQMTAGGISGTSPCITVLSSLESRLVLDPGFVPTLDIPYANYQSANIQNDGNSVILTQFLLRDGDGVTPDLDGAATNIQNITFSITNPTNIRSLALYVGGTEVQERNSGTFVTAAGVTTVTFNNLSASLSAPDNNSLIFSVRASFNDTEANVTDNDLLQLHVTNVTQNGGSKFLNETNPAYVGGIVGGAISSGSVRVEVLATSLDFVTPASTYAGILEPIGPSYTTATPTLPSTSAAIVHARDRFAVLDLDFTLTAAQINVTGATAGVSSSKPFVNGILDLDGMRYTSAGNGTLRVIANSIDSSNPVGNIGNSISGQLVNVVHTSVTAATNGVLTTQNIKGGTPNAAIFGVTFTPDFTTNAQPSLKRFIISFNNPYRTASTTTLKNPKVQESLLGSFAGSTNVTLQGATVTEASSTNDTNYDQIIVDWGSNSAALFDGSGNATPKSYFLVVDVDVTANISTPELQPRLLDGGYGSTGDNADTNIITTQGTASSTIEGLVFKFASTRPPVLKANESVPFNGQLNVNINLDEIHLMFDVEVWSLDHKAELWDRAQNKKVANLDALNGAYVDKFSPTVNPLRFKINFDPGEAFQPDAVYFVKVAKGALSETVKTGISDNGYNFYGGISSNATLYFKISSANPPVLSEARNYFNNRTTGSFSTKFDQRGKGFFIVLRAGSTKPTVGQIRDHTLYPNQANLIKVNQNNYDITLVNAAQVVTFSTDPTTPMSPSTNYDVWICAENDANPTAIPTNFPYGNQASGHAATAAATGPTLQLTIPPVGGLSAVHQPNYLICPSSFVTLTQPIIVGEVANSDFFNGGAGYQEFYILLPTGFQFGDLLPTVEFVGSDFILTGPVTDIPRVSFVNSTIVRIQYKNTTSSSLDKIIIRNIRVIGAAGSSPGEIKRFAGNALQNIEKLASLTITPAQEQVFTNSYTINNDFTPFGFSPTAVITAIPDNYADPEQVLRDGRAIRLIPLIAPTNDYGPSSFTGNGVTNDVLSLGAATLDAAFDITMTHTDLNGCVSQNNVQYVVYDHRKPISPKLGLDNGGTQQALENENFPAPATTVVFPNAAYPEIKSGELAGYTLIKLYANIPTNAAQIISGPDWQNQVAKIPHEIRATVPTSDIPGLPPGTGFYRDYQWDYNHILNAVTESQTDNPLTTITVNPYDNFKSFTPNNVPYWKGGSLGKVEFTGTFQSTADLTVLVPFRQEVELFVPPLPVIEVNTSNRPVTANAIYCENGGGIIINGYPAASAGSSTGTFAIFNDADSAPLQAAAPNTAFVDNGNGTATLYPFLLNSSSVNIGVTNGYRTIRVTYRYQDNNSPTFGVAEYVIRIAPNPVATFTVASDITANTPLATSFCEGIPITFDGSTSSIADGVVSSYKWDFDDINDQVDIEGTSTNVSHTFVQSLAYNPTLVATSDVGCKSAVFTQPINIGIIPVVSFTFLGVSTADQISFTNTTVIPPGTVSDGIDQLDWEYGDSNTESVTSGFSTPVTNQYGTAGKYDVTLAVTSNLGCVNEVTQMIIILPRVTPTDVVAYSETFEIGDGGWQTNSLGSVPSSWAVGTPAKPVIVLGPNNDNRIWTTNLTGSYNPREVSALFSPSFDLSQLGRPMISFDAFRQLLAGEGLVIQFSLDNKNVVDPTKEWIVLGEILSGKITGVQWYNGVGLGSQPGNESNSNSTGLGWTGSNPDWIVSKHLLDKYGLLGTTQAVFRFALATTTTNPSLDGFAIDNVRVGNRTRTILVENFKNLGKPAGSNELSESNFLKTFRDGFVGTKLVTINYHVGFPQVDPLNEDNPADPSSRALYYNIQSTPNTRLDGNNAPGMEAQPFSVWGEAWYDEQTLKLANATIEPTVTINTDGSISVEAVVKAVGLDLPASTILHVAVVEREITALPTAKANKVTTGETAFEYVLKQLLPSATGTRFEQPLLRSTSRTFDGFQWTPESTKLYPNNDDLAIIVFVQNEITREVYQSEVIDLPNDPPVVTGLEDILAEQISLFPNPADRELTVQLPAPVTQPVSIQLIDQVGKAVYLDEFSAGEREKQISTEDLAGGIYIVILRDANGGLIQRKVMVVHRN